MKRSKLLRGALTATVLFGVLASTASARSFETSSATWEVKFTEVHFRLPFFDSNCGVTMEGTFHSRTIAKAVGSLIGYVTHVIRVLACRTGSAGFLALPWHVQYRSFSGT